MGDTFKLELDEVRGCLVTRLAGEIDLSNASGLERHLTDFVKTAPVVVDLALVTFMDSTALSAMIAAYHRAAAAGTSIRLAGARGPVRKVLDLTRLTTLLDHHDQVADAVDAAVASIEAKGSDQPADSVEG